MTLDLFPYQREGAAFLARKHRGGLFDDMGVGKSAQAIAALDQIKAMKVLIICPAAVRQVWIGEFAKFSAVHRRILKGRDIQDLNLWLRGKCHVLILSYEMAASWAKRIEDAGEFIDAIVFDEAHYMKNDQAARTRAMLGSHCTGKFGLARWATHVWFLTGTPNPNDAADIWSMMRFAGATKLTRKIFRDRYYTQRAGSYSAQHTPRKEMVPELKAAIKSFSLRRTKAEAGLQLPPIWLTNVTVDGDTAEVAALMREYPDLEKAIIEAIERGGLSFLDAQHVATLRRLVGEAKAPSYLEMLKEELHDGAGKRVVFGIHTAALRRIRGGLEASGVGCTGITGETSERDRTRAMSAFADDPDCRVFVGNIRAAGTGLTLTASADVDMFESAWDPASNAQAIMRVHRVGQTRNVSARFITLANSIDVVVNETVERKTRNIAMTGTFSAIGT